MKESKLIVTEWIYHVVCKMHWKDLNPKFLGLRHCSFLIGDEFFVCLEKRVHILLWCITLILKVKDVTTGNKLVMEGKLSLSFTKRYASIIQHFFYVHALAKFFYNAIDQFPCKELKVSYWIFSHLQLSLNCQW